MAPEIQRRVPYTFSVDWYSLGIICYELLTQTLTEDPLENHQDLISQANISDEAKDLISKLLESDPSKRLGKF